MSLPSDVSAFGAFDMAANAWEWTSEYYDSQYYQQFRTTGLNPFGLPTGPGACCAPAAPTHPTSRARLNHHRMRPPSGLRSPPQL